MAWIREASLLVASTQQNGSAVSSARQVGYEHGFSHAVDVIVGPYTPDPGGDHGLTLHTRRRFTLIWCAFSIIGDAYEQSQRSMMGGKVVERDCHQHGD